MDSFTAHESEELLKEAKSRNVDIIIIPGGCTSKIQPVDVCLNRPFKCIMRHKWKEYMEEQVEKDPGLSKLVTPSKEIVCQRISAGLDYLRTNKEMVKKSFLVCGISNALDGSQSHLIHCAKELPNLQLPYLNESEEDPFLSGSSDKETDQDDNKSD